MGSPAGPFKTALEAALRGSAALATAAGGTLRIYTERPVNAALPYIVIGDDQVQLENVECADEAEVFPTVHIWSRKTPLDKGAQARAMGSAVIDALNTQLTVAGWDVTLWGVESETYITDPDQSSHGIINFRHLLLEQVA